MVILWYVEHTIESSVVSVCLCYWYNLLEIYLIKQLKITVKYQIL